MILIVTRVCCELTVTECGEGTSWILPLLLLHTGVSTIGIGGISWLLLLLLLRTGATIIGTGCDRGREYYIELTICRSINLVQEFIEKAWLLSLCLHNQLASICFYIFCCYIINADVGKM